MKVYNKNELKHSRVFFDKKPPRFGVILIATTAIILLVALYISSVLIRPYIVKAEGLVTTVDNQYVAPSSSGNVIDIVAQEGTTVSAGDTLIVISNGQEKTQTGAIVSQLETLSEKERALNKYLDDLNSGVNSMSNSGFEIEYYGKMEYYIDQLESDANQVSINNSNIEKKNEKLGNNEAELVALNTELTTLKEEIEATEDALIKEEKKVKLAELESKIETKQSEIDALIEEIDQMKQQQPGNTAESTKLQLLAEAGQTSATLMTQRTELEGQLEVYSSQDELLEIKATNSGEVHYLTPMTIGLGLQQNQVFAEISTHEDEQKIVEVYLSAYDRSKVDLGQKVNVNVLGVNSTQFGVLKGSVVNIENGTINQETKQGSQSFYRIRIAIDSFSLKGGDGDKTIEILKSMPVQAQIVYEEETYLMWILEMLNLKK